MVAPTARVLSSPVCNWTSPSCYQGGLHRWQLHHVRTADLAGTMVLSLTINHVQLQRGVFLGLHNAEPAGDHHCRYSVPSANGEAPVEEKEEFPATSSEKGAQRTTLSKTARPRQREVSGTSPGVWRRKELQTPNDDEKLGMTKKGNRRKDVFAEKYGPFTSNPDAYIRKAMDILKTEEGERAKLDMLGALSRTARGLVVTLFNTLVKEQQVDHCVQVLRYMVSAPGYSTLARTMNIAIKALADNGKLARAEALYKEMKEKGVAPDTFTFNTLIAAYAKRGLVKDAEIALASMQANGLKPDAHSYSGMIMAYAKQGQVEGAEQTLQLMLDGGVLPNVYSYTALIGAYARAGDVAKAEATFEGMQQVGCAPDVFAFSAMVDAYAKQGLATQAEATFRAMLQARIEPSVVTYSAMVAAYAKGGQVEKAEKVLQVMQEAGCAPNMFTFNSMMEAYVKQKRLEDAEAIFEFVKAAGLKPTVQMYTTLITGFGKVDEVAKAINYWKAMRKAGCPPDQVAYHSIIELYKKIDRPKRVQRLELEMEMQNEEDKQLMTEDFFNFD